jgi:hypothetical protein
MRIVLITVKHTKIKMLACLCTALLVNIIFLIAILKGEPRRFEPRPHLKASRQTQFETFLLSAAVQCTVILNGIVVTALVS